MKRIVAVVALLVMLVPAADAQMTEHGFAGNTHARVAYGDVPLSADVEAPSQWHVIEYHRVTVGAGQDVSVAFALSPGFTLDKAWCTCGNVTVAANMVQSTPGAVAPGAYVVAVASSRGAGTSDRLGISLAAAGPIESATVYTRSGQTVTSNAAETQTLPGADHPEYTIHAFQSGDVSPLVFLVNAPTTDATAVTTPPGTNPWIYAAAGLILGCVLWAILVSRGMVQRKSRKQIAATAAHVEAAQSESLPVLEGRKRALMAALKEIELARQGDDLDVATYDVLKAELKKEAVTVMRAIDEAGGKKA